MKNTEIIMGILILVCGLIVLFLITSGPSPRENLPLITTPIVTTTQQQLSPVEELTTTTVLTGTTIEGLPLSDLQISACEAADEGGTCFTKLPELNLVSAEDCCKYLGKCCEI
ncbi:MAG: hypothetical protein QXY62_06030 [Candidatus Altiarchaeota archaeon]